MRTYIISLQIILVEQLAPFPYAFPNSLDVAWNDAIPPRLDQNLVLRLID